MERRMLYHIQQTPYNTLRLYVTLVSLSTVLENFLNKHCCWGGADKKTSDYKSWEFPVSEKGYENIGDRLAYVMESHGIMLEEKPKTAEWLQSK